MGFTFGGQAYEHVEVAGPPDCFFLAVQVSEHTKTVNELRALAADYMTEHKSVYECFQDEAEGAFDAWVASVRSNAWAEHRVIDALQLALRRRIHVHRDDGAVQLGLTPRGDTVAESCPIRVVYNGHNHYCGLRECS